MNYYLPTLSSQLSSETISRRNPTENKPMFCLYDQPQHFGSQWVERPSAPQHFGEGLRQRNERSWFQYNSFNIQVTYYSLHCKITDFISKIQSRTPGNLCCSGHWTLAIVCGLGPRRDEDLPGVPWRLPCVLHFNSLKHAGIKERHGYAIAK